MADNSENSENSENFRMMEVVSEKIPTLMKLVNREQMEERDLKLLYQEASRVVGNEVLYKYLTKKEIPESQLDTGYACGGHPTAYFHTLLYALKIPGIEFINKDGEINEKYQGRNIVLNLPLAKDYTFQGKFQTNYLFSIKQAPACLNMLIMGKDNNKIRRENEIDNIFLSTFFY